MAEPWKDSLEFKLLTKTSPISMWCYRCHNTSSQEWKATRYLDKPRDIITYHCGKCHSDREYIVTLPHGYQRPKAK